jgi:hypothetical protein
MQNIIDIVTHEWRWAGLVPKRIIDTNKFGNLIVEHQNGFVWRIVPEELSCEIVAKDAAEYEVISQSEEFVADWQMQALVEAAEATYGPLADGDVFYLVTPGVLGGEYDVSNINVLPLEELIALSGDLAKQIKDLPDGGEIELKVTE